MSFFVLFHRHTIFVCRQSQQLTLSMHPVRGHTCCYVLYSWGKYTHYFLYAREKAQIFCIPPKISNLAPEKNERYDTKGHSYFKGTAEQTNVQFKERITRNNKYDVSCEMVALSNSHGGKIVVGVKDSEGQS